MSRQQTDSDGTAGDAKEPASQVYGGIVADIIAATPRESDPQPSIGGTIRSSLN